EGVVGRVGRLILLGKIRLDLAGVGVLVHHQVVVQVGGGPQRRVAERAVHVGRVEHVRDLSTKDAALDGLRRLGGGRGGGRRRGLRTARRAGRGRLAATRRLGGV